MQVKVFSSGRAFFYFSGSGNNQVSLIDVTVSGCPTTIVSGASAGGGFANGLGNVALYSAPSGAVFVAAWGPSGSLIIADTGNNALRRLDLVNYNTTTVVGAKNAVSNANGVGTSASFSSPIAIAIDFAQANMYVVCNSAIRAVDVATLTVTTLAGRNGVNGPNTYGVGTNAIFYNVGAGLFRNDIVMDNAGSILVMGSVVSGYGGYQLTLVNASTGATSWAAGVTASTAEWADGLGTSIKFDICLPGTMTINRVTGAVYFFNSYQNSPGAISRA